MYTHRLDMVLAITRQWLNWQYVPGGECKVGLGGDGDVERDGWVMCMCEKYWSMIMWKLKTKQKQIVIVIPNSQENNQTQLEYRWRKLCKSCVNSPIFQGITNYGNCNGIYSSLYIDHV